jgi:preprotein translocase subunit SecA
MPAAFAVLKSTAFRFPTNEIVDVTANDFDRNLLLSRNSIEMLDKALWHNKMVCRR